MGLEGSVATRARPDDVNVVVACGICRPDLRGYADPGLTDLIASPTQPLAELILNGALDDQPRPEPGQLSPDP